MYTCLPVFPLLVVRVFHAQQRMRDGEADKTECIIRMTLLIVGVCAAVLALIAVTVYARRALKEALLVRLLFFSCAAFRFRILFYRLFFSIWGTASLLYYRIASHTK